MLMPFAKNRLFEKLTAKYKILFAPAKKRRTQCVFEIMRHGVAQIKSQFFNKCAADLSRGEPSTYGLG
jgi:hypothetical protein